MTQNGRMHMRRAQLLIVVVALAALAATGCGGRDVEGSAGNGGSTTREPERGTTPEPGRGTTPEPGRGTPADAAGPAGTSGPCTAPERLPTGSGGRAGAQASVAVAVRSATRTDRRFVTRLAVRTGTQQPFTARLAGTRRADGTSRATLRWSGAAGILLPDAELAIAANRIRMRSTEPTGAWHDVGSASGASLDVGRELLDHPFLLQVVRVGRDGDRVDVELEARPRELRAHATTERWGPVTELLRDARSLRVTAHLDEGELVGDRFRLVTTIPPGIPVLAALAGRPVRVEGTTGSCPATSPAVPSP